MRTGSIVRAGLVALALGAAVAGTGTAAQAAEVSVSVTLRASSSVVLEIRQNPYSGNTLLRRSGRISSGDTPFDMRFTCPDSSCRGVVIDVVDDVTDRRACRVHLQDEGGQVSGQVMAEGGRPSLDQLGQRLICFFAGPGVAPR